MNTDIPANFTLDDVRTLLESKPEIAEGFYITKEWATHFGLSVRRTRILLGELLKMGKVERKRIMRENLAGEMSSRPGFKIILDKESNDGD